VILTKTEIIGNEHFYSLTKWMLKFQEKFENYFEKLNYYELRPFNYY